MSELAYIDWLRQRTPPDPRVPLGLGDDTAALLTPPLSLITTDMLLEGSCFLLEQAGPRRVGRKALAVNLSDIAAMAGVPVAALVSLGLPRRGGLALAQELYLGMRELADAFGVAIIGGDTNSWDGGLVVSVTLLGQPTGSGPVRRSGAKPGDWLLVTGPLGGSIHGKHLDFTPRVREAQALHATADLHAMIDISDGLATDLAHLCTASGCSATLEAEALPIAAAVAAHPDSRSPLDHALHDGEDFELLVAVSPADGQRLIETQPIAGVQLVKIGQFHPAIAGQAQLRLRDATGEQPLQPRGWVHALE
jgi:thiamine-monophosphate kinase